MVSLIEPKRGRRGSGPETEGQARRSEQEDEGVERKGERQKILCGGENARRKLRYREHRFQLKHRLFSPSHSLILYLILKN